MDYSYTAQLASRRNSWEKFTRENRFRPVIKTREYYRTPIYRMKESGVEEVWQPLSIVKVERASTIQYNKLSDLTFLCVLLARMQAFSYNL